MKVLIVGGGIGGLTTAIALQESGIRSVVFEAAQGPADARGLFLGLAVNGLRVLRSLGLAEAVSGAGAVPTPSMVFESHTGRTLGRVESGRLDARTPSVTIMRGRLQRVLADEAGRRGIPVRYGKRLERYEEIDGGVAARFADGSIAEGHVLLGADGIHSRVRAVMDPQAPGPRFTGLLNLGGVVPASGLAPTPGAMHMLWGRRAFFGYTVRPDGEAWWFVNAGSSEEPSREVLSGTESRVWRERLRDLFAGDPAFVGALIGRTDEIGAHAIHDLPSLPTWHRGPVALLGDAAHAVSPSAGQGASLAMEDALVLAKALRDSTDPRRAVAAYEAERRHRAERIAAVGRRRGRYKAPSNRATLWLRDLVMPLALRLFARPRAMAWVHDYEVPWHEPDGRVAA